METSGGKVPFHTTSKQILKLFTKKQQDWQKWSEGKD